VAVSVEEVINLLVVPKRSGVARVFFAYAPAFPPATNDNVFEELKA